VGGTYEQYATAVIDQSSNNCIVKTDPQAPNDQNWTARAALKRTDRYRFNLAAAA
jgi:hypothetical protein